jgi:hypothetical protein
MADDFGASELLVALHVVAVPVGVDDVPHRIGRQLADLFAQPAGGRR